MTIIQFQVGYNHRSLLVYHGPQKRTSSQYSPIDLFTSDKDFIVTFIFTFYIKVLSVSQSGPANQELAAELPGVYHASGKEATIFQCCLKTCRRDMHHLSECPILIFMSCNAKYHVYY